MRTPIIALLTLVLVLPGCALLPQQEKELTAEQILAAAAEKMQQVSSAHFRLESTNGSMTLGPSLTTSSMEGDVAQPDKLRLTTTATMMNVAVEVQVVSAGGKAWMSNPLSKQWLPLQGVRVPAFLDAERGIPRLLKDVRQLNKLENEKVDGVESYHLAGTIDRAQLAALLGVGGEGPAVKGELWVGTEDFLVRQVRIEGPLAPDEPEAIVRVLKLSDFNQPVSIEPPA